MKKRDLKKVKATGSDGEKGAAMVMVLMISFLLLVASAGLILEVSMNTSNVTDATAEQQAYNAAESGIQSALNVLRGNTESSPLLDESKESDELENIITFRRAVTLADSNEASDTTGVARLSRWINYNYTPSGATISDRVSLGDDIYEPYSGYAYSLEVEDPDNTGDSISYNTSAKIDGSSGSLTLGSGVDTATISYIPTTNTSLDVSSGSAAAELGRFVVEVEGSGAIVPDQTYRFEIHVNFAMTSPYIGTKVIRGSIAGGVISGSSVGTVSFDFDSKEFSFMGSMVTLNSKQLTPNAPDSSGGETAISGSITQVEPYRLLVKSTGYGPRGAQKVLEAVVLKNFFNGMSAPSTLTLMGSSSGFVFAPGTSTNVTYSGADVTSDSLIPSIGTSSDDNLAAVFSSLTANNVKTVPEGEPANVAVEIPLWLQTPAQLDDLLQRMKSVAAYSGSYYPSGATVTDFGDSVRSTGLTYVDGDFELSDTGGGILIVTGKLTLKGSFTFNGLIIVTGSEGVVRKGGGGGGLEAGVISGNVIVAPYDPNDLATGFSSPKYDISGGGDSTLEYNSSSLANGLTAASNFVLGVAEK